ncbi:Na+/H+ antiporter NhaD type [Dissulfuribacter thermophilus]|uniref:Na+/H+ antiporter NhaD type n=1 Tax=Dissulfuribacter thermophilus TaxID=1156395 RepID=A0A1B9F872_9BACT|nr:ArsB/NhaD family transporter [Dissulfuribacter thermophilus]OCC16148.1 Na+/H+ antiporter NhaD type [Dissulfuribacter thermophilus]
MKLKILILVVLCLIPISFAQSFASQVNHINAHERESGSHVILDVHGKIVNPHNTGVGDVSLSVFVDGKPAELVTSESHGGHEEHGGGGITSEADGTYQFKVLLPADEDIKGKHIEIKAFKPSYERTTIKIDTANIAHNGKEYMVRADMKIKRTLGPAFWIATVVFILAYVLISFELLHRTLAAMLGAATMLVISYTIGTINPEYHILSYESAIRAIDMNVVFLLMGMMIIVGILKNTGIFQWTAYKCYQLARGNVIVLAVILMSFTAISSAFLDNVTTMLLLTPVSIEIALSLGISPLSLLIPEILASNIGGTATLIGDPPNIMIGSYAGLTFMDFVIDLTPVCIISMIILFIYSKFVYKNEYSKAKITDIQAFIEKLRQEYQITDGNLLTVGLIIMGIVIAMFLTHGYWHMEVSIAALFGASLLFTYGLITKKVDLLHLIEKDIEWPTLLFFIFLFILVGAVEETGLLDIIADWVLSLSQGSLVVSICLILWVSAIMSAFVDNIPFTATMLPIVGYLTKVIPGAESGVLWWALAFGACFGGNGTMIGASANVVTLGIAESAGYPIRFFGFMKIAFIYMLVTVGVANIWLLLFY